MTTLEQRLASELEGMLNAYVERAQERLKGHCESPIESALLIALVYAIRISGGSCAVCEQQDVPTARADVVIVPQYPFDKYRVDFAYMCGGQMVFVECDGHDFHERTKEQAGMIGKRIALSRAPG